MEIKIRRAVPQDLKELRQLYIDTVTNINSKDYDENQIRAWIKPWFEPDTTTRDGRTFADKIVEQYFIVAVIDNTIAGLASLEDNGYLDFMYVHKDFQRHGAAKKLLNELENYANEKNIKEVNAIVSKTALGFFEKHGWIKIREDVVEIRGATFVDNIMIKKLE
ncbi:MAG: GNAT family N-acetyltransferase [Ignavibacteria bacterium]|nr:GNAT family N-acetyltransferase [Ignavibacteria bacterium]